MNYFVAALKKYAGFSGRAGRAEYWNFVLYYAIVLLFFALLGAIVGFDALIAIGELALFVPSLAVGWRRMHDIGKAGPFCLIPVYNIILAVKVGDAEGNKFGPNPKENTPEDYFSKLPVKKLEETLDKNPNTKKAKPFIPFAVAAVLLIGVLVFSGDSDIARVKNGSFNDDKGTTIEKIIKGHPHLTDITWSTHEDAQGRKYVVATGKHTILLPTTAEKFDDTVELLINNAQNDYYPLMDSDLSTGEAQLVATALEQYRKEQTAPLTNQVEAYDAQIKAKEDQIGAVRAQYKSQLDVLSEEYSVASRRYNNTPYRSDEATQARADMSDIEARRSAVQKERDAIIDGINAERSTLRDARSEVQSKIYRDPYQVPFFTSTNFEYKFYFKLEGGDDFSLANSAMILEFTCKEGQVKGFRIAEEYTDVDKVTSIFYGEDPL